MQMGKGRDLGMLQTSQFEGKIAGGSAISLTTRDAARVTNNIEFFRMISLIHTWAGYYITNAIITLSTVFFLYFYLSLALSGADSVVVAPATGISIVGTVLIINWIAQLGGLYLIPLFSWIALEHGVLQGLWRSFHLILSLGPLFYVAQMQTKAYYFDQAISFGRQAYLATGRDFVIRHTPFSEIYRFAAHSHLYLGMELLYIMMLILVYGTFRGTVGYVFFFTGECTSSCIAGAL